MTVQHGERTQCPFCLRRVKITNEGKLYRHDQGRLLRRCPGSAKSKAGALAMKANMRANAALHGRMAEHREPEGGAEVEPEDIF